MTTLTLPSQQNGLNPFADLNLDSLFRQNAADTPNPAVSINDDNDLFDFDNDENHCFDDPMAWIDTMTLKIQQRMAELIMRPIEKQSDKEFKPINQAILAIDRFTRLCINRTRLETAQQKLTSQTSKQTKPQKQSDAQSGAQTSDHPFTQLNATPHHPTQPTTSSTHQAASPISSSPTPNPDAKSSPPPTQPPAQSSNQSATKPPRSKNKRRKKHRSPQTQAPTPANGRAHPGDATVM